VNGYEGSFRNFFVFFVYFVVQLSLCLWTVTVEGTVANHVNCPNRQKTGSSTKISVSLAKGSLNQPPLACQEVPQSETMW